MTPSWLLDLLAALMLAIAAGNAARIVARPLLAGRPWRPVQAGTDVDLANALMGVAMAGMFTSSLTTLPSAVWEVVFGLLTAWFAYRAWADARSVRDLAADRCTLHVVHSAAMLYMFLGLGAPASGGGGMGGMGGSAMPTLSLPTLAGTFALLLLGYSVWDLNQLSSRRYSLASAGGPATGIMASGTVPSGIVASDAAASDAGASGRGTAGRALLLAPETRVGWDVVLGIAMAFMLVIMI
jgi:hypothetical protein